MRGSFLFFVVTTCLATFGRQVVTASPQQELRNDTRASAVADESWINHLHRAFGDTSMGKTGRLGPGPSEPDHSAQAGQAVVVPVDSRTTVTLHGSDLYRLNCRACHGEGGLGAPPEINSVINPVRATSARLVMERMKVTGMEITPAAAAELAKQAKAALAQRLHNGGESMPPFAHFDDAETQVLLAYLNQLAGVTSGDSGEGVVKESPIRIGEHVVKSTCHICHDSTGANPTAQQLEDGAIPPLGTLTARVSQAAFIRKVTIGAPIVMGTPPMPHRGRMPVFYYLTSEEAVDAYLYLATYPPQDKMPTAVPAIALSQTLTGGGNGSTESGPGASAKNGAGSWPASELRRAARASTDNPDAEALLLIGGIAFFVIALLVGGFVFTMREFRRLAGRPVQVRAPVPVDRVQNKIVLTPSSRNC